MEYNRFNDDEFDDFDEFSWYLEGVKLKTIKNVFQLII